MQRRTPEGQGDVRGAVGAPDRPCVLQGETGPPSSFGLLGPSEGITWFPRTLNYPHLGVDSFQPLLQRSLWTEGPSLPKFSKTL